MTNFINYLRITVILLAAFIGTLFINKARATDVNGSFPVRLEYLEANANAPIFELSFTNENSANFVITILEKNDVLYNERITGKTKVRKYQFVKNEAADNEEEAEITVKIMNLATKQVAVYTINPATRVQKEWALVSDL